MPATLNLTIVLRKLRGIPQVEMACKIMILKNRETRDVC
jgi:hypothetical protein